MTRTQRLLELLQLLRAYRYPVTAKALSERLKISVRTIYRDIRTLQDQGVCIEGSAGIGYMINSDYHLPPLIFTPPEINALTLGLNWVCNNTSPDFKKVAKNTIAKIHAVIPKELKEHIEYQSYLTGPIENTVNYFSDIHKAIGERRKLSMSYTDKNGAVSSRVIWPVALAYMDSCWLLAGWCEMRKEFRHFRTDRIQKITILSTTYDESRFILLKRWREKTGINLDNEY